MEVTISDSGAGKKKTKAEALTQKMRENYELMKLNPLSNTTVRGRGLAQIVLNWSDKFEIQDNAQGGLTMSVVKNLTPECQEPPKKMEEENISPIDIKIEVIPYV